MQNRLGITFTLFYALLSAGPAIAEELEKPESIFDHWRLYFYLGDYHADTTKNQLESPGSEYAFGFGGLFNYSEYLDWGFDAIVVSRDYDTPENVSGGPFTVVGDDMTLNTLGLTLTARFNYTAGRANLYAGAGAGLYLSKLRLTASTLGFVSSHEETSNDFGYFYNYGVMFNISNGNYLGLEYRNLSLDTNLSPVTTGTVDIGGDFLLVTYAVTF